MFRSLLLCALFAAPLFAQTTPAPIIVYNAASHLNPIAPGSFVSVDVRLIGNATPDLTVDLTTSDGAKVRLATIAAPTPADVVNTTEVWVVIPPNASLGSAVVTATMGGVAYDTTINIRSTGPGIFTAAYNGAGPAVALNYPSTPNALTSAAVPNGIVSLFATGLNGATAADVIVGIGTQAVTPLYAGPQGQPGLDQINFVIPSTPIGCYIPLTISVRGSVSNIATLSVNHDPYACAHPLGLSYSQMKTLDAGGTILLASLSLAAADNSGANQPVSAEGAAFYVVLAYSRHVAGYSGLQGVPPQQQLWGQSSSSCSTPSLVNVTSGPGTRTDIFSAGAIALAGPSGKQLQLNQNAQLS